MKLNSVQRMLERARNSESLQGMQLTEANAFRRAPFPLTKPWVCFSSGEESGSCLLGDKCGVLTEEKLFVSVSVGEDIGGEGCRETAGRVCMEIMRLDEEIRIISVSVGKPVYDSTRCCWRTELCFGLRPARVCGGEMGEGCCSTDKK